MILANIKTKYTNKSLLFIAVFFVWLLLVILLLPGKAMALDSCSFRFNNRGDIVREDCDGRPDATYTVSTTNPNLWRDSDLWRIELSDGGVFNHRPGTSAATRGSTVAITVSNPPRDIQDDIEERQEAAEDAPEPSCENQGILMGWLICPLLGLVDFTLQFADRIIVGLFEIDSRFYDNDEIRGAWANIRNIGYLVLVPALLLMVIGTALGFEFVSAYTVKKALPRMIAAVVFMALSYEITVFAVNFTHDISRGIAGLIYTPFGVSADDLTLSAMFDPTGLGGEIVLGNVGIGLLIGAGFTALATGGIFVMLSFITAAALVLLIVALVLALRQMFIIGLMLISPLAILGWIFPGNTKLWSIWRGTFMKLLLIYPIIVFLTAVGRVFAHMISQIVFL